MKYIIWKLNCRLFLNHKLSTFKKGIFPLSICITAINSMAFGYNVMLIFT